MAAAAVLAAVGAGVLLYRAYPPTRTRGSIPGELPCELRYTMDWNSLSCASFRISLGRAEYRQQPSLRMSFSGGTLPVISWAWSYRADGFSYADPRTGLPVYSQRHTRVEDGSKRVYAWFDRSAGKLYSFSTEEGEPEEEDEHLTAECRPGLDLQSAFLYMGQLDWQRRKTRTFEVIDEDELYSLSVRRLATETVRVQAGEFETVKVGLSIRDPDETSDEEKSTSEKYRTIQVWISRQPPRVPVKMRSKVFVGSVGAELTSVSRPKESEEPQTAAIF